MMTTASVGRSRSRRKPESRLINMAMGRNNGPPSWPALAVWIMGAAVLSVCFKVVDGMTIATQPMIKVTTLLTGTVRHQTTCRMMEMASRRGHGVSSFFGGRARPSFLFSPTQRSLSPVENPKTSVEMDQPLTTTTTVPTMSSTSSSPPPPTTTTLLPPSFPAPFDVDEDMAARVWRQVATSPDPSEHDNKDIFLTLDDDHGGSSSAASSLLQGLVGTYYVNGLASCHIGDGSTASRLIHPFESHGFLKAIQLRFPPHSTSSSTDQASFSPLSNITYAAARVSSTLHDSVASVSLTAKYVTTPARVWESFWRRPLFRGAMSAIADTSTWHGQLLNALSPTQRDTANLAVRVWPMPFPSSSTAPTVTATTEPKLFVSSDNGRFYGIDPQTLTTRGVEYLEFPSNPSHPPPNASLRNHAGMLAHTRIDNRQQRLVTCALQYEPTQQRTVLTFHEFDDTGALQDCVAHTFSPAVILHDWSLTENYYVIPAAIASFDLGQLPRLIMGKITATGIFSIDENVPASCFLIPRPGSKEYEHNPQPIHCLMDEGRHGVVFHMGPAYETILNTTEKPSDDAGTRNSSTLEIFPFVFDRYQFGDEMGFKLQEQTFDPTPWAISNGGPRLEKWILQTDDTNVPSQTPGMRTGRIRSVPLPQANRKIISDMPTFHPHRDGGFQAQYIYTVCGLREQGWFPFNAVAKHDVVTGRVQIWPPEAAAWVEQDQPWDGGACVWAEPLFVPRPPSYKGKDTTKEQEEDDGWVLSTIHDTSKNTTSLAIFDARNFGNGPIITVQLADELWGWNIHSTFVPTDSR